MKTKKSRILLSAVSVLLVFSLLAGGTMAWFTDTEKVDANFTAGILDINVKPDIENQATLEFKNLRPMQYTNFNAELNAAGGDNNVAANGMDVKDFAPAPVYFQPVKITNDGTLPTKVDISVNLGKGCTEGEENIELTNDNKTVDWDGTKNGKCSNYLQQVLKIFVYRNVNGAWERVEGVNLNKLYKEAAADPDGVANDNPPSETYDKYTTKMIPAGGEETYVIAGYLPETVGNVYQGKHYHADVMFNAYQMDENAGGGSVDEGGNTDPNAKDIEIAINYALADTTKVGESKITVKSTAFPYTVTEAMAAPGLPEGYHFAEPWQSYESTLTGETASAVTFIVEADPVVKEDVQITIEYFDTEKNAVQKTHNVYPAMAEGQEYVLTDTDVEVKDNLPTGYVFDGTPQRQAVTYPGDFTTVNQVTGKKVATMTFNVKSEKEDPNPETDPQAYTVRVDYVVMDGDKEILLNGRSKTFDQLAKGSYIFRSASVDNINENIYECAAPTGYRYATADQTNNVTIPVENGPAVVKFIVELDNPSDCTLTHIVHNEAELRALENHMDHNFLIAGDFALTRGWNPLGLGDSVDVPFTGYFDGNGNTISELHTVLGDYSNIGLFALNNGRIENLNLSANQMEGSSSVGTVAGENQANGIISNVHVTGNYVGALSQGNDGGFAGGLVGKNRGIIENCSSKISGSGINRGVVAHNYAGGLVGGNWRIIRTSYAIAGINSGYLNDINANNVQTYYAGGLVGGNQGMIENCYANVNDYIAATRRAGGFAGFNGNSGTIQNCFVIPNDRVYGGAESSISVGLNNGSVSNSYAESTTSGAVNGFTRATKATLTSGTALNGFDASIWNFTAGNYPDLKSNAR